MRPDDGAVGPGDGGLPLLFFYPFPQETGVSPHAYLLRLRLHRAQYELRYTTLDRVFIAQSCGFNDVSYFSRVFQQKTKLTPTQFRTLHPEKQWIAF